MEIWSLEILQLPYNSRAAPGKMQLRNRCVLTANPERRKEHDHSCPQAEEKADHVISIIWTKSKTETERNTLILSQKDYGASVFIFFSAFKIIIFKLFCVNYFEANFYIQYLKIISFFLLFTSFFG